MSTTFDTIVDVAANHRNVQRGTGIIAGMAKLPETFNERLKWLRTSAHLTQPELVARLEADGVKIGRTYISELESTTRDKVRNPPTGDVVAGLARVLGTTTDYLLCMTDDPERPGQDEAVGISPEAERVARMVDTLTPRRRAEAERLVEVIAESSAESSALVESAVGDVTTRIRTAGLFLSDTAIEQIRLLLLDYAAQIAGVSRRSGSEARSQKVSGDHLKNRRKQIVE